MAFDKELLERIRKLPSVEKVEVKAKTLIVHTEMIQLTSPDNKKVYDVGRFKILIKNERFYKCQTYGTDDVYKNNPNFINKDIKLMRKEVVKGIIHPHIFYYGPCWGNMLDSIKPAVDSQDFFLATILCLQYLKNVNPGGSYSYYLEEMFPLSKGADDDAKNKP